MDWLSRQQVDTFTVWLGLAAGVGGKPMVVFPALRHRPLHQHHIYQAEPHHSLAAEVCAHSH